MARPRRFNLLLVRGDGTRILRIALPQWAIMVALGGMAVGAALVATSLGAIYSDYLSLRSQRATFATALPRLAEQQALLDAYQARARELRAEINGWREIHARILEPFGPEAARRRARSTATPIARP
jgi:cell division protein FtsB